MKKAVFELVVSCVVLSDQCFEQELFQDRDRIVKLGFTFENLKKMRNSTGYESELYFDALRFIH